MLKIAIMDDGVDFSRGKTAYHSIYHLIVSPDGVVSKDESEDSFYKNSHGTTCFDIIHAFLMVQNVKCYSLKILDSTTGRGDVNQLIAALHWCAQNNIDIINCSLGTTAPRDFSKLKQALNEIVDRNIVLIAAMCNKGGYTLPACYPGVIGVKNNVFYKGIRFKLKWYPLDEIEIETCGESGLEYSIPYCNSFAGAKMTALVANAIGDTPAKRSVFQVLTLLQKHATVVIGKKVPKVKTPYPWDEGFINNSTHWQTYQYNILKQIKQLPEVDVPVISIVRNSDVFLETLCEKLSAWLSTNYIYNQIFSDDNSFVFRCGGVFVPPDINTDILLSNLQNHFCFDALIFFAKLPAASSDLVIEKNGNRISIKSQDESRRLTVIINESFSIDAFANTVLKMIS